MATTVGRSSSLLRLFEVASRQIEVVHRQQQVGGFDQVFGGDRRRFADAALGEGQADLLLGVVILAVLHHQPRDGQASFNAIGVGGIQRAREAVHRRLPVAQRQQRIAGVEQNRRLIASLPLGCFDVTQRLVALAEMRVSVRHCA